jgi:hypothetical protein
VPQLAAPRGACGRPLNFSVRRHPERYTRVTLAQLAIAIVWAAFILVSVRAFWRRSDDPAKARRYALAKFNCVFSTIGSSLLLPSVIPFPGVHYAVNALFWAIICFPVALCVMYFASAAFLALVDSYLGKS